MRVFETQRFPCLAAIIATVASASILTYFSLRRGGLHIQSIVAFMQY